MEPGVGYLFNEELYLIKGKTMVIIDEPWSKLSATHRELLQKILQSVRLSLDSVILNHQPVLNLGQFTHRPAQVIYFGQPVKGLEPFQVLPVDGTSVVLAPSLNQLQEDPAIKPKLWNALKLQFGL